MVNRCYIWQELSRASCFKISEKCYGQYKFNNLHFIGTYGSETSEQEYILRNNISSFLVISIKAPNMSVDIPGIYEKKYPLDGSTDRIQSI